MSGTPLVPQQTDGKHGLRSPTLSCLNLFSSGTTPQTYHYIDDDIKVAGVTTEHALENDGSPLGSDVRTGFEKGNISLQYDKASDSEILPGFVVILNKGITDAVTGSTDKYFQVNEAPPAAKRNQVKRAKLAVTRMYNPVSILCQGALGNYYEAPACSNAGADVTVAPNFANWRTGTVKSYTALSQDNSALPTGVSINAGTGLVTINHTTAVIGTYFIVITATDTLSATTPLREGTALVKITVTA